MLALQALPLKFEFLLTMGRFAFTGLGLRFPPLGFLLVLAPESVAVPDGPQLLILKAQLLDTFAAVLQDG